MYLTLSSVCRAWSFVYLNGACSLSKITLQPLYDKHNWTWKQNLIKCFKQKYIQNMFNIRWTYDYHKYMLNMCFMSVTDVTKYPNCHKLWKWVFKDSSSFHLTMNIGVKLSYFVTLTYFITTTLFFDFSN